MQLLALLTKMNLSYREVNSETEDLDLYLTILHSIFFDVSKLMQQYENNELLNISKDDFEKLSTLETEVDFLKQCVGFLKLIDSAIDKMVELLETTSISDMQEAIHFFIAAYQFNIDRASIGILGKLSPLS